MGSCERPVHSGPSIQWDRAAAWLPMLSHFLPLEPVKIRTDGEIFGAWATGFRWIFSVQSVLFQKKAENAKDCRTVKVAFLA